VSPPRERIAAIDVGSNTILLTVAEYGPGHGLAVIEEGEDQPRLAAGLSTSGRLSEEAMGRALRVLTGMRDTCRRLGAGRVRAVATAAVREASNGVEFVHRVHGLDIPLGIISPETEAALSYRSAAYRFPGGEPTLVADIGGASLELTGAADGRVRLSLSLPLGAVRLTERGSSVAELRESISSALRGVVPGAEWRGARVIGSGGTFATLAALAWARRGSESHPIHGTLVRTGEVTGFLESLEPMSPDERRQTPGLRPERADIIVAGLAVVAELLETAEAGGVMISAFGLRDGLLLEMAGIV
jgi:exopolyphosphatase / guanosine-5'-triphosphate,3'-diphosphate pyrophosphatase